MRVLQTPATVTSLALLHYV